jgi:hypothetical protein
MGKLSELGSVGLSVAILTEFKTIHHAVITVRH